MTPVTTSIPVPSGRPGHRRRNQLRLLDCHETRDQGSQNLEKPVFPLEVTRSGRYLSAMNHQCLTYLDILITHSGQKGLRLLIAVVRDFDGETLNPKTADEVALRRERYGHGPQTVRLSFVPQLKCNLWLQSVWPIPGIKPMQLVQQILRGA